MSSRGDLGVSVYGASSGQVVREGGDVVAVDEVMESEYGGVRPVVLERGEVGELPDSGLVEALHYYVSGVGGEGEVEAAGWFDETALLALGVVVEEMARAMVGGGEMYVGGVEKWDELVLGDD